MSETLNKQQLVESFVNRTELSPTELVIKAKALDVDAKVAELRKEINQLTNTLQNKNAELLNLAGQLDGMIDLMANLEAALLATKEPV